MVLFDGWVDTGSKTKYYAIHETTRNNVDSAVKEEMPYPYSFAKDCFKPFRFNKKSGMID